MLRALFEGVMFEHRRHVEVLAQAGVSFDRVALSGGGSRSPHWPQMFADGLGKQVTIAESRETGALGAVIGAAIAVGIYGDYETAVAAMSRAKASFAPNPSMQTYYGRRYAMWTRITEAMDPIWRDLAGQGR